MVNGCSGERTLINGIPFLESPLIIGHFFAMAIFFADYTGNDPCHLGMTMLVTAAVAAVADAVGAVGGAVAANSSTKQSRTTMSVIPN